MAFVAEKINAICHRLVDAGLGGAETGAVAALPAPMALASVQFAGTFGGATAILEVSNDATNWLPMDDKDGNAVSATSGSIFEISSGAAFVRAKTTGGTDSDIDVYLVLWA